MKTAKTTRKCRACRGERFEGIMHVDGRYTIRTCETCQGLGIQYG